MNSHVPQDFQATENPNPKDTDTAVPNQAVVAQPGQIGMTAGQPNMQMAVPGQAVQYQGFQTTGYMGYDMNQTQAAVGTMPMMNSMNMYMINPSPQNVMYNPPQMGGGGGGGYNSNYNSRGGRGGSDGGPRTYKVDLKKTSLCNTFTNTGSCKFGDNCKYAHGKEELREPTKMDGSSGGDFPRNHRGGMINRGGRGGFKSHDNNRGGFNIGFFN